jgi:hypothetical protein
MKTNSGLGPLSRRQLLLFAAAALAAGSPLGCDEDPPGTGADGGDAGPDGGPEPEGGDGAMAGQLGLPACFTQLDSMRRVGRRYLQLNPSLTWNDLLSALRPERGFAALEAEIREQYARGQLIPLDGWPLAVTELRIYAALALS